ncbi:MAG: HPr family phosphocarrier protein [Verrucomicrobia bacterium]|nr:HPr family phosphocarrier protein [Pseudomonadota bacterium]NBS06742.1 HPr family phosphocarrier protein [Verrucomicrobiota bacterium]NBS79151.1 HPr family phosphocarrier protein [bacterium]NBS49959.1 HPr family phosphocarrier protein [Verrucomicrobiota bacterium]NBT23870.1 HPr family phosphocarrier protein [bacterium]
MSSSGGASVTKEVSIQNRLGLHARPAAMFVREANRHACEIFVEKDGETINGKSIMGLMMLAAGMGSKISLRATGPGAETAIQSLLELIERKFDEE